MILELQTLHIMAVRTWFVAVEYTALPLLCIVETREGYFNTDVRAWIYTLSLIYMQLHQTGSSTYFSPSLTIRHLAIPPHDEFPVDRIESFLFRLAQRASRRG